MKNYVKPEMQVELFAANQYVASCGKRPDGTYIFKCDAPAGNYYYYTTNWWGQTQTNSKGSYHPCGETHTSTSTSGYYEGFIDRNYNRKEDEGEHVLCWIDGRGSGHATVSLTMGEIEVERS